jgi:L,D-peptidoglycan transpeptidase YkuD (ErfK/YbiS/YcfS/YnhG family)
MKIKILTKIILLFSVLLLIFSGCGCVLFPITKFDAGYFLTTQHDKLGSSSQILLVKDNSFFFFSRTKIYAMEKHGNHWRNAFDPMNCVIGRNGFAPAGGKKEGDGKTPSGIYPLKMTFGYDEFAKTKMPYRRVATDDIWVDDTNADDYNLWTKKQTTRATSYEMMKRDDDLYKYGIVIDYNTNPVIKGKGSAIFLHIWKGKNIPTAGCVAVSEENMMKVLEWLDPMNAPLIITGVKN